MMRSHELKIVMQNNESIQCGGGCPPTFCIGPSRTQLRFSDIQPSEMPESKCPSFLFTLASDASGTQD